MSSAVKSTVFKKEIRTFLVYKFNVYDAKPFIVNFFVKGLKPVLAVCLFKKKNFQDYISTDEVLGLTQI